MPLGKHVVLREGLHVLAVRAAMGARDHAEAAVLLRRRREGDPGRHFLVRRETEVRGVLVPGDVTGIAPVLGEYRGAEEQDVGPDQILDGIEYRRRAADLHQPRKGEVALDLQRAVRVVGRGPFVAFDPGAAIRRLRRTHRPERIDVALASELRDLRVGQQLRHGRLPTARRRGPGSPAGRPGACRLARALPAYRPGPE